LGAALLRLFEFRARRGLVDEPPLDGALSAHALGERAERVGEIAAHLALVDDAREAARAGEHAEERALGKRDRGRAIVAEQDFVAREGELVAAARRGACERAEARDAAAFARLFQVEARLVRELAEVHLE